MDPINIIVALNIIATFGANASGAKKGFKSKVTPSKEKPSSYLQTLPIVLSILTLLGLIISVFQIGTINYSGNFEKLRLAGLIFYLIFSWLQIWAFKTLGENYSQDVLIFRSHNLITKGPFKFLRHPQYLSQILMDLGGGIATLSFIVLPLAVIEIPFLILRAILEEKLLEKNFKETFLNYKKKSGFFIPFIG
ncbi:MAG: methyltransferase family protein [Ignavibacteriaceae bacterium]